MKLMVRYDDDRQYLELSTQNMGDLWLSLSVEDGDYTPEEREKILQEAFDAEINRPDYNCHHRWENHRGYSAAVPGAVMTGWNAMKLSCGRRLIPQSSRNTPTGMSLRRIIRRHAD